MNQLQSTMYMLKGVISDLPAEQQADIEQMRAEIRAIVDRSELGLIALALAGAELEEA